MRFDSVYCLFGTFDGDPFCQFFDDELVMAEFLADTVADRRDLRLMVLEGVNYDALVVGDIVDVSPAGELMRRRAESSVWCDNCGDPVAAADRVNIARLQFPVASANVGESAVLCRWCDHHLSFDALDDDDECPPYGVVRLVDEDGEVRAYEDGIGTVDPVLLAQLNASLSNGDVRPNRAARRAARRAKRTK